MPALLLPIAPRQCNPEPPKEIPQALPMKSLCHQARTCKQPVDFTPDGAYRIDALLGEGGNGVVHLSTEVATGDRVAIKIISIANIESVAIESTMQGIMNHPNIVSCKETIVDLDGHRVYLVMELCHGGELFDLIAEVGHLAEHTARHYFGQLASAIAECHTNGVYHRDLKPENILLDDYDNVKIADFGLAMLAGADINVPARCGSVPYVAPEVLTSTSVDEYSAAKADIWSLGVVLFVMVTGKLPFKVAIAENCATYSRYLEHGFGIFESAKALSSELVSLLKGMLHPIPESRFTATETLASSWLSATLEDKYSEQVPGQLNKWCDLLGYGESSPTKKNPTESTNPYPSESTDGYTSFASTQAATSPTNMSESPGSVNDMLVRTLGWVQLPTAKEGVVQQVMDVIKNLGMEYSIAQSELSDVVMVDAGDSSSSPTSPNDLSPKAGNLTVRLEINSSSPNGTDLNISRHKGSVMRFHSFYRGFRKDMADSNGWSDQDGGYLSPDDIELNF